MLSPTEGSNEHVLKRSRLSNCEFHSSKVPNPASVPIYCSMENSSFSIAQNYLKIRGAKSERNKAKQCENFRLFHLFSP